jgi:hypothetical protein
MSNSAENVAKLKDAYRRWDEKKGKDTTMWTKLFSEKVRFRSLAAGRPGLEFTLECQSPADIDRYFAGLAADWDMIHYTTDSFAVEGDRIVMLGSTSWKHKKTGRVFDTPKVDLVTFRDGRIVEFFEFYDTDMVLVAARA